MFDIATQLFVKGIMMPEKTYSNKNQLGLWKVDEAGRTGYYNGYGDIGGNKVYDAYLIVHSARNGGKGAFASLFFRTDDGWKGVDIWNNEGKLGGRMETEGFWVNVFKNDVESGSKRPALSVKFKPMEAAAAASAERSRSGVPDPDPNNGWETGGLGGVSGDHIPF